MNIRRILTVLIFLITLPFVSATSYYYKVINPNDYEVTDCQVRVDLNSVTPSLVGQPIAQIYDVTHDQMLNFCYEQSNGECSSTVSTTGILWVKVPSLPARDYVIIRIDYDGSTNGAVSGDQVFLFYDDFNRNDITDKWSVTGDVVVSNGIVSLSTTSTDFGIIESLSSFTTNVRLDVKVVDHTDYVRFDSGFKNLHYNHDDGGSNWWGLIREGTRVDNWGYDVPSQGLVGVVSFIVKPNWSKLIDPSVSHEWNIGHTNAGVIHIVSWADSWTKIDWVRVRTHADQDPIVQVAYSQSSSSPQTATSQTTTFEQTYGYVKIKYIAGLNSAVVTDIAIPLVIDTQTWINEGKLQSDCSDLYITYYDPVDGVEKPAPYFVDKTTCNTPNTIIYVKLPQIASDQDVTLFIYHGVPGTALPYEDPKNTFYYFVDLSNPTDVSNNLDIFTSGTASYEITSSGIHITTGSDGYVAMYNK